MTNSDAAFEVAADLNSALIFGLLQRRGGRVVEGTRLLIWRILYRVPRVRIPPSPPNCCTFCHQASSSSLSRNALVGAGGVRVGLTSD